MQVQSQDSQVPSRVVQEVAVVLREMATASWIRIYQLYPSLMCIQEGTLVADLITPRIAGNVSSALNQGDSEGEV